MNKESLLIFVHTFIKKNVSYRLCIDYRSLKKIMIKYIFSIPIVDELFHRLHGAKYLFNMDLKSSYYQKRIREEGIPKNAFCIDEGLY
jgi:putative transposase